MGLFTLKIIQIKESKSIGRQLKASVNANGTSSSIAFAGNTTRHHPILKDVPIGDKALTIPVSISVTEIDPKYNDGPYSGTTSLPVDPNKVGKQDFGPFTILISEVGKKGVNPKKTATLDFYFEMEVTCKNNQNYRTTSEEGIDFITANEGGIKNKAYKDSGGTWTIGIGHKIKLPQEKNYLTTPITDDQAKALLRQDIAEAENAINALVTVCLTQNQFDALVDFTFQEGRRHFAESTLRKKINAGAPESEIRAEFAKWIYIGKIPSQNLIDRRKADADLFFTK